MAFRLPKLSFNKDWLILGGTAALAVYTAVLLHNRYGGIVPTIPGVSYGSGGPATGFYTGNTAPYTPVPLLQPAYADVRPYTAPVTGAIQTGARDVTGLAEQYGPFAQANWGGFQMSGSVGRGGIRDAWTDVYDPSKGSASITGDDPTHRLSIA
jgi:hypothetical protein